MSLRVLSFCAFAWIVPCVASASQSPSLGDALKSKTTFLTRSAVYGQIDRAIKAKGADVGFFAAAQEVTAIFGVAVAEYDVRQVEKLLNMGSIQVNLRDMVGFSGPTRRFMSQVSMSLAKLNAPLADELVRTGALRGRKEGVEIDAFMVKQEQDTVEQMLKALDASDRKAVQKDLNRMLEITSVVQNLSTAIRSDLFLGLSKAGATARLILKATDNRKVDYLRLSDRVLIGRLSTQMQRDRDAMALVQGRWTYGMAVKKGDRIRLDALGNVELGGTAGPTGPEGTRYSPFFAPPSPDSPFGCLLGRVVYTASSKDELFEVGKGGILEVKAAGRLELCVNDGYTSDNSGFFVVRILRL